MKGKVALHNLGCKVNAYETEAMQQMLEAAGYEIVPFEPGADIYVINTCSVTNIADRKSRQMLHKAKKMNPDAIVVAAGCYVQADTKKAEADASIDIIIGNNKKQELIPILESYRTGHQKTTECVDINHTKEYENLEIDRTEEHTRAYLKVQDGCNQFCTYCIIPYARGRIRSKKTEDVVNEVKRLAASGCQEVVLTGIHLSSYGKERPEDQENLLTLIQAVHQVDGIERIRLGSLEPGIITEEFAAAISSLPKVCPHFHLSLQSGCTTTLKRMNRRYTAEEYREKCEILRKYYPAPALTTDVITGFPGETEEEFEESRSFVDSIHFYETHIFPYSKREGTKAAGMPDQLTEQVKKERSRILIALGKEHQREYMEQFLGQEKEVLFEEQQTVEGQEYWTGHTMEYLKIAVISEENLENKRVMVQLREMIGQDFVLAKR
ncbi:tRNA (N(6)-L-threonylcarbamoyladenosine(37)-C(2))-methylthiotransferase MtaB [Blautia faecicola]|uniref:Threonylcarbamoyladenosine tRNA methylthiotransferase MtaB n=1 Tax=Blautia faecicola TaxID=2509240 RepID=A0A4Q1RFT5_9FIRM|nr:tRNA (N(6)-L-threonylcarbamoyladenosine(37)-C(2))-methylthiotransferase MtaB [Blautia faecicola]RXS74412.1 tRNA (N(6)-L-threonylcarbamoyladenosine(37)-C(2))-methylthiotransferase MtaB [Blautia faecicola]